MTTFKHFGLLLIAALLIPVTGFSQNWKKETISGEGPVVTEELKLDDFHSIGLGIAADVFITKGSTHKVTVKAQKNLIDNMKREVKNESWNINWDKNVRNHEGIVIEITMPSIQGLAIGGSGKILVKDEFNGMGNLKFSIGGSGTIEMAGSAESAEVSIAGSGDVKVPNLNVKNCKVSIAGSGNAYVEVHEKLDISIAGSGNVNYKGRARVSSSIAGSGKVKSIE